MSQSDCAKRKCDNLISYVEHFSVLSHDVDANNNARPSIISRLMQETANHHMRDRKPTYYDLFFRGQSFIATRIAFEVKEQLHPYDNVDVHTWTSDGKGATFMRSHEIVRDGEVIVRSYSEWAVADRNTGKLCRTSDIDFSNYEKDEPLELKVPVRFHFPPETVFVNCGSWQVNYCDCDMNLHMNNTNYQDMIWNFVPEVEHKKLTSFSLRFMAEAPVNSIIEIERSKLDSPIDDGCGAEESYYFRSKVNGRTNIEALVSCARTERETSW